MKSIVMLLILIGIQSIDIVIYSFPAIERLETHLLLKVINIGILVFIARVLFGQVIQKYDEGNFVTCVMIGGFRFNLKIFNNPASVILTQDNSRYYYLMINLHDEQAMLVEKHPTLDKADERLAELRDIFSLRIQQAEL